MELGYARVSRVEQNLDLQLDALRKAGCKEPIYTDKLSGARDDRPQLELVLNRLSRGDTLIVWKLDRLGRSLPHLVEIINDLRARKIGFKSITESGIDTTSDMGELVFLIFAWLAQFERNIIIERTVAGRQAARARGKFTGSPRRYGDEPRGEKQKAAITPEQVAAERDVLLEVTERLLGGETAGSIVRDLNTRKIPTTNGKHWRSNSLRQVMANPNIAPIIGQDESDKLQRIFADPLRKQQGRPARHLLSGIVRCQCGNRMYVQGRSDGKPRYTCYSNVAVGNCGKVWVAAHLLEEHITEKTIKWLCGPGLAVVRNRLMQLDRDLTLTAQKMHADEIELETLAKLKGQGRFTVPEWLALRDPIEERIRAARDLLAKEPAVLALTGIPGTRKALEAAWQDWDMERKRSILKAAIAELKVYPTASRGPVPFDEDRVQLTFVSDVPPFDRPYATELGNGRLLDQVARDLDQE
jgi:DNA invertase Pin-like site-specific DNA recombinase